MKANAVDHFSWFQTIPALADVPFYFTHAVFVALLLTLFALLAYRGLKDPKKNILPERHLSIKTFFELLTDFILTLLRGSLGHDADKYVPLVGSVFTFVFISNVIGLIPGFQSPTTSLNTNFAIAIIVFVYYNYLGIKEHGFGYLKHFMGPIWWLAPVLLVIEFISHFVRPLSLSLRLFGNMTGDHLVLNLFYNMTYLFVPVIFLALGLFVCFIQAFVFSLLSVIYISLAVSHEH